MPPLKVRPSFSRPVDPAELRLALVAGVIDGVASMVLDAVEEVLDREMGSLRRRALARLPSPVKVVLDLEPAVNHRPLYGKGQMRKSP